MTCGRTLQLNQFHWHIVDSQSFPLVVPEMPELSAKGAYAKDQVYTPKDIRDIVNYAAVVSVLLAAPITRDADHTRKPVAWH